MRFLLMVLCLYKPILTIYTVAYFITIGQSKTMYLSMTDQYGYYYNYTATFYGTNTVTMTFQATNGDTAGVAYGTQFTYNRVQ